MTVKSADKKPEKYVGPDGKPKIRMVSVDKEVVKNEAYDEPQGQAKRIMSPLQKARMDKEKADRDKDGKLKSEGKTFKDFREANTPVGQRDKMKIIDRKPHPDGGHIVTMQTKAGKTIKRHLKNGKVKDMTEATDDDYHKTLGPTKNSDEGIAALKKKHGMSHTKAVATMKRLMGEAIDMSKVGTKATIMHPVTRVSKKVDKKDVKKHVDAGWMHMGPKRNRVTKGPFKTKEGYASDAQRKAVWASKNEKGKKESVEQVDEISKKTAQSYLDKTKGDDAFSGTRKANNRLKGAIHAVGKLRKKESVDEVLDTPKAMRSYKDKAKYSRDRASGSAAAKILSKGTLGSHKPELDTMRKRHKGMDMVDRLAKSKTFKKLRGEK